MLIDCDNVLRRCSNHKFSFTMANCGSCDIGWSRVSDCGPSNDRTCAPCKAGTFGTDGRTCVPCPPGSYQPSTGSGKCLPCAAGTFQDKPGQTSCKKCGPGEYQDATGKSTCEKCPYATLLERSQRTGLKAQAQCSSLRVVGIWMVVASGYVGGGSSLNPNIPVGVKPLLGNSDSSNFVNTVAGAVSKFTFTEYSNLPEDPWLQQLGYKGFSVSKTMADSDQTSSADATWFQLSPGTTSKLAFEVEKLLNEDAPTDTPQLCSSDNEQDLNAFLHQWVYAFFEVQTDELLFSVNTRSFWCTFHHEDNPNCPPGFCVDKACKKCREGCYENVAVDKIFQGRRDEVDPCDFELEECHGSSETSSLVIVVLAVALTLVLAAFLVRRNRDQRNPKSSTVLATARSPPTDRV